MKLIITDTYPKNGEKTFVVDSIYMDRLLSILDGCKELPDRAAQLLRGAVAPKQNGDTKAIYTECGNCGVPRFQHGTIIEACPNCGDDEIDVSLIVDVP